MGLAQCQSLKCLKLVLETYKMCYQILPFLASIPVYVFMEFVIVPRHALSNLIFSPVLEFSLKLCKIGLSLGARKMCESGSNGSNARKQNCSGSSRTQPREEAEESNELERKLRCPCGSDVPGGGPLVQVELYSCFLF